MADSWLIADASEFVDSKNIQGVIDFWGNNLTCFVTKYYYGTALIVSLGDDDEHKIGDTLSLMDNSTFNELNHNIVDIIHISDNMVISETKGIMKEIAEVDMVATFK